MDPSALVRHIDRLRLGAVVGVILLTAGRILDLWWHSTHHDFERGLEQVQAHWLAWAGALLLGAVAFAAVRRHVSRTPGFLVMLASAVLYGGVAVWHFWLHQQGVDPDLPHALLALSQVGLYVAVLLVVAGLVVPACRRRFVLDRVAAHA